MSEDILYADGFEGALLGIGVQFNKRFAIYDYDKCIKILMDGGMTDDEALEWMDYNVIGAYVGESTPAFLMRDCTTEESSDDDKDLPFFLKRQAE